MITSQISLFAFYAARVILFLLVVLSIFSLAFFVERMLYYKNNFLKDDLLLLELENAESMEDIAVILERHGSSESDIIINSLKKKPSSAQNFALKVGAYFRPEKEKWEKYTVFLGSIGSNAPFIGLLGTVLGILKSFADLGVASSAGPKIVMAGISEALILTAMGLAVAIPAVVFFNICKTKIKAGVTRVESITDMISSRDLFTADL